MARILIVDDDETMLDLEKMILVSAGYDVLVAKTAQPSYSRRRDD